LGSLSALTYSQKEAMMKSCSSVAHFCRDAAGVLFWKTHCFFLAGLFLAAISRAEVPHPDEIPIPVESDSAIAVANDTAKAANDSNAQTTKPVKTKTGITELAPINVIGHYQNKIGTTSAASSGTYSSQLLEDRPILRPGEVEELVPGLIVTQHSGAGKANQFLLRGFNLDHGTDFATTVDGVPVNLPTQGHGQGYDDLNFVIPELIDHADYFKGTYNAAEGDFSSAGAINIFYVKQLGHPFVTATLGSYGYYRSLGAVSTDLAGGKLLLGLEAMHQDGPFVVPQDFNKFNGLLRWSRQLGEGTFDIEAMGYFGEWNATNHIPQRAVTEGLISRWGTEDSSDGGTSHRFSLSTSWKGQLGGGVLSANAYLAKYDMDLYSDFTYFLDDTVNGDQMYQKDNRWFFGTSDNWQREFSLLGFQEKARIGLDARCDLIDPVGLLHTVHRRVLESWGVDSVTEAKIEPWIDLDSRLTPWIKVMLGLRGVYLNADVRSDYTVNSGSAEGSILLPKVTVVLGPWSKTEFYANYGDGYHSNDVRGATATINEKSGDSVDKVTLLVRSRGFEVGARNDAIPGLQSSLALWLQDFSSELVWDADEGTTDPSAPSRRMGVEWSERWQLLPWLLFDLDVAYSQARFINTDTNGQYVPEAIETAVSAGASIHRLGPWSASLFVRYFGPRALVQDNSERSDASTLFNGQIAYDFNRNVRLTLDVLNIFNAQANDMEYYYATRLKGEPAAGISDFEIHPSEPLSFRLSLTIKL
jgi:TonB dependent receptor/TonB-dependent Receptor Plug Domain